MGADLPNNSALNPLQQNTVAPVLLTFSQEFSFASKTKFSSGAFTLISFISSFYVVLGSTIGVKMNSLTINSTHFKIQYDRNATSHNLLRLIGTIVVFDPAAITAGGGQTLLVPKNLISTTNINYTF